MTTAQAILFWIEVALTPSMLFVALMLWRNTPDIWGE